MNTNLDCVVIGYNEVPFSRYEQFLHAYGEDSEAYRDLKFSFVKLEGNKLDYPGLLNHVRSLAGVNGEELKSGDIPNLAAAYLTNLLRRNGHSAEYINLFQYEKDQLIEYLRRDPLCVAITTTFYVVNLPVTEMVDFIRSTRPDYYRSQMWYCEPGTPIQNERRKYEIEGEGFVWEHASMDSMEAMDHIDRMFLEIKESVWLPQWSFDFWIIPYLMGKGD